MRILFARHGETDWNVRRVLQGTTDTELNANGIRQAHLLGEAISGEGLTCVYTSRLKRAGDTARIAAGMNGIPVVERDGLQEICFGDWEGHGWNEIISGWPDEYAAWKADRRNVRPPNGENHIDVTERVGRAVAGIIREARGDMLVLTHRGCILLLMAALKGASMDEIAASCQVDNGNVFEMDPGLILERFG